MVVSTPTVVQTNENETQKLTQTHLWQSSKQNPPFSAKIKPTLTTLHCSLQEKLYHLGEPVSIGDRRAPQHLEEAPPREGQPTR